MIRRSPRLPLRARLAVLGCALPLLACTSDQERQDEENQLLIYETTANYLWQDGSLVRAQDQAVKALEIDPDHVPMRRMIGWIRLRMGAPEDVIIAEQFFRALYEDGDEELPTLLGLATAQERLGVAADRASKAIASGERYTDAKDPAVRARDLAEDARAYWEKAHANYTRVLAGPTRRAMALNGLQRVDALRGRYEESLEWGRQLVELAKGDVQGWRAVLDMGETTETETKTARYEIEDKRALQIETHLLSTSVLYKLGRTGEALDHLREAIELAPERPDLYAQRAQLRAEVGEFAEAIDDVDRFLRLSKDPFEHPDVRRAYELRKQCEAKLAETARASE